ncbi:hypothetical protein KDC22_14920 [Paenibacillus tritici]|uniref:hypothetical protein n=1 Tax=Paenibacillus tritici TaxID=1873425 RepID=UPI001BA54C92|nr:hypothetical protein [Paenibacillus tritici]QUL57654.1 hypothetical protein KDC22_14920 [Paenibacillus tritici]
MKKSKVARERLKVVTIAEEPLEVVPYVSAARGSQEIVYEGLPVYREEILGLPVEVEALIVTSDLQGMALHDNGEYGDLLVGEMLPATLEGLLQIHLPGVHPDKVLVCLCGDLYGDTAARGSNGDPLPV